MSEQLATIARNKLACTGVALNLEFELETTPSATESGFDALVSGYYKLFRETLAADIAFLGSIERRREISSFDNDIYLLRTAKQHDDNSAAKAHYASWLANNATWTGASEALTLALTQALDQLARISGTVRRDRRHAEEWRSRATIEPEGIFDSVCIDLGARFTERMRDALIASVKRRAKRLRSPDMKTAVEDLCAQEICKQMRPLPVPYYKILDRLGLLGEPHARAALLVAYSIASSTQLRGEDFFQRVEATWKVAVT